MDKYVNDLLHLIDNTQLVFMKCESSKMVVMVQLSDIFIE